MDHRSPGIRSLGLSRDLIITGSPLERAWQREDSADMQAGPLFRIRHIVKHVKRGVKPAVDPPKGPKT